MSRHWSRPGWTKQERSSDPQDWTVAEWILYTSPFGLGHVAQKFATGKWGTPKTGTEFYTYLVFAVLQTAAYGAVGIAFIAPSATLGHVRHVVSGQALKAISPKGPAIAAPMLLFPNLVMLAGMFGPSAMGDTTLA